MLAEIYILVGFIFVGIAIYKGVVLVSNFFDMRYSADCVEDLKFNIMRLFLEQQNILAEFGVKKDFRLHNNKFFSKIVDLYQKMYDSYEYISTDMNTRLREEYVEQLRNNYGDNINSINTTIVLLNAYSCRHNYARDMLPSIICDKETKFVEDIDPRRDHGIDDTGSGLIQI